MINFNTVTPMEIILTIIISVALYVAIEMIIKKRKDEQRISKLINRELERQR